MAIIGEKRKPVQAPPNWREAPIPGAPPGKTWRMCDRPDHDGPWYWLRTFHGLVLYECIACRAHASVTTRTGKTCMNCGKPLTGRQINWCCPEHGTEVADSRTRQAWADAIKQRDRHTCQQCGWHLTPEIKAAFQAAFDALWAAERLKHWKDWRSHNQLERIAASLTYYRDLEAHHVHPLEWGGSMYDLENGRTLCVPCHKEEHRQLRRLYPGGKGFIR